MSGRLHSNRAEFRSRVVGMTRLAGEAPITRTPRYDSGTRTTDDFLILWGLQGGSRHRCVSRNVEGWERSPLIQ